MHPTVGLCCTLPRSFSCSQCISCFYNLVPSAVPYLRYFKIYTSMHHSVYCIPPGALHSTLCLLPGTLSWTPTEAKFLVPDWGNIVDNPTYVIVDYIPQSGTKTLGSGLYLDPPPAHMMIFLVCLVLSHCTRCLFDAISRIRPE
jgi:hypothetical protein